MALASYDLKYVSIILYAIAVVTTCFRFYLRVKMRRWWWDDSLALLAMLSMCTIVIGVCLIASDYKDVRLTYYLLVQGYYIPIWSARLSVLCTVIRFARQTRKFRKLLFLASFFIFQCALLTGQAIWCFEAGDPEWKHSDNQPRNMSIAQISTAVLSDLLLIVSPIWVVHDARLHTGLRFRIVFVFSTSVATTVAATAHILTVLLALGSKWIIMCGVIEVFVALSVSNAAVLIPIMMIGNLADPKPTENTGNIGNMTVLSTMVSI